MSRLPTCLPEVSEGAFSTQENPDLQLALLSEGLFPCDCALSWFAAR
jgi:hypothetical protein